MGGFFMWIVNRLYYRAYQLVNGLGMRFVKWPEVQLVQGEGSIEETAGILRSLCCMKPLVITGPVLHETGVAGRVLSVLEEAGIRYALFAQSEQNPSIHTVEAIRNAYMQEGCDGLLAVGGGSPLDAAKAAGARIACPDKTLAQMKKRNTLHKRIPPFIAIPTTAGTGSEATISAAVTDPTHHHKYAIIDTHLSPDYAILDPAMTASLPKNATAATGMDALAHAVEGYLCWTGGTRDTRAYCEHAIQLIFEHLETAYKNPDNLRARAAMLLASHEAGLAASRTGVGNAHAIAHAVGGMYNTSHGLATAVILPIVLEDYGEAVYKKLARLADVTGVSRGNSTEAKAKSFVWAIRDMNLRMGLPARLTFIEEAHVPLMITYAFEEANPHYPVPVLYNRTRFRKVIERVWS